MRVWTQNNPTACDFHPTEDILYVGTHEGYLKAYKLEEDGAPFCLQSEPGDFFDVTPQWEDCSLDGGVCRAVRSFRRGDSVLIAAAGGSTAVIDAHTGRIAADGVTCEEDDAEDEDDCLHCLELVDNNVFVTGAPPPPHAGAPPGRRTEQGLGPAPNG